MSTADIIDATVSSSSDATQEAHAGATSSQEDPAHGHQDPDPVGYDHATHNPSSHDLSDHSHLGHDHEAQQVGPVLNPDCVREVAIEASEQEVERSFRRVVRDYQKHARVPGFRPGKVPESLIRRRYAEQIRKDVVESLLPERFQKAVEELGSRPVSEPRLMELVLEEGKPLSAKAVFEVVPPFSVDGYDTVFVDKPTIEVTEEEFQDELKQLRDSRATVEPVEEDRPVVDGDWVEMSYSGLVAGREELPPIQGENTLVEVGGKDTLEAFTNTLRGAKVGDELQAEVIYPDGYHEANLAGKTVSYEIEVKAIKKRAQPELNDDFAKEVGDYESLAALEERIRQHLANRKRNQVAGETKDRLLAALTARFDFPVPEAMVQAQIDARLERGLRALAQQGMDTEQMRKLDFARLRAAQRDQAVAEVKASILIDRIADAENIAVSDEELDRELHIAALQNRESFADLRARLTNDGGLARIREQMRREKTANLLYERLPA